ncbi:MAG: gliding motility-associated C-terminal domain-containing protein [Bacteroidales bacterium]|nr:gliding motility-associated C-terminal domain-containing protein [Bacteroidales bacterium]
MQDIEKLARSAFENAEQTPPREVWENIESELGAGVGSNAGGGSGNRVSVASRRWLWALAIGVAVTGASVFTFMRGEETEQTAHQTFVDTGSVTVAALKSPETVDHARQERRGNETVLLASGVEKQVDAKNEHQVLTVENVTMEEDSVFDLLEHQLRTHEFDIRSDEPLPTVDVKGKTETQKKDDVVEETPAKTSKETQKIEIFIPNILTPNGDGYNDCWVIPDLAGYGRVAVQIYTAQSKRVYVSDDYRGDFCGDDLPSGNYFYVLTLREHNYSRRGVLVIKR